ncbi:MAG: amidohydrolase family protein, partial [Chitinivibrionales bacterium]|nr:amidohydrolase family protein [Chitinivibrionales bacterium]MBD3396799.1 amidohydrolase family protein [Chitinivibrionales bacterium]
YRDGTLIGTSLGLSELLPRLMLFTKCSLADAVKTVTVNPARVLGMEHRKGAVEEGKDGDLVLLDQDRSVFATVVSGAVVYGKDRAPQSSA